ncbi:spore germination protein [Mycoplasmatota bacterium]|nr:spore germination protein [Mycoplasmatota bacterium]
MIGVGVSFDVGVRTFYIKNIKILLYYCNSLTETLTIVELIRELLRLGEDDVNLHKQAFDIIDNHLALHQVMISDDLDEMITNILSGLIVILVEDNTKGFILDVRNYPGRQPQEPETEKVVRGSRDGFTENIITDVGLIRRRIRDPLFRTELFKVGSLSKTDVCLLYIDGLTDDKIVNTIRKRIQNIEVDELVMADKQLEELITNQTWNPYPKVRYTERPDILSVHLYDGLVGVMVDTSPSVMIAPTTFLEQLQHVEEFRQTPVVGTFLRLARTGGILVSLFLVPTWMLVVYHPELLPKELKFIGPKEEGSIPIVFQILSGEIGIEFLRMAAIHTPTAMSNALGIVAGVLIGQIAIEVGLFSPEVVLYVAVAAIGSYATPSYELGLANKISKIFIIIFTFFFGLWGLIGSTIFYFLYLAFTRSFGKPYLYPLIPFNFKDFITIFIRVSSRKKKQRKRNQS